MSETSLKRRGAGELELLLLEFLLRRLPLRMLREYAKWWREMAAGDPEDRQYIAQMLERSEVPRA